MKHGIPIQTQSAVGNSDADSYSASDVHNYSTPLDLSTDINPDRPRSNLRECFMFSDSNPLLFYHRHHLHHSPYHSITNSSPMTISTTSPSPVTGSGESDLTPISSTIRREERESPLREIPRNDNPTTERRRRRNLQAKKIRDAQKHRKIQLESEIRYLEIRNGMLHNRVRRLIQEKTALQNAIVRERLSRMPHINE